jgi:isoleucyl-tRNA synthetase
MSQFKEYKNLNLIDVAENVAEFWKQNKTFNKSVEIREGNLSLFFMKVRLQQTVCLEFTT